LADSTYNFPQFGGLNLIENDIALDPSKRSGPMQALEAENIELFHNGALDCRAGKKQQGFQPGQSGIGGAVLSQSTVDSYTGTYGPTAATQTKLFVYSRITMAGVAGVDDVPLSYIISKLGVNTEYYSLTCQIRADAAGSPPTLGAVITNGQSYPANPYPVWPVDDWIPGLSGSTGTLTNSAFPTGGSTSVIQDYVFNFPGDGPVLQGGTSYWIGVEAVPNTSNPSTNPWVGNGQTTAKCLASLICAGHHDTGYSYTRYQGLNVAEAALANWQLYFLAYGPASAIQGLYDYKPTDLNGVISQKVMAASQGNLYQATGPITATTNFGTPIRINLNSGKNFLYDFQTFKNLLFMTDGS
jgi:hypothetical protein